MSSHDPPTPKFLPGDQVVHHEVDRRWLTGTVVATVPRETDLGRGLRGDNFWSYRVLWTDPPTSHRIWSLAHPVRGDDLLDPDTARQRREEHLRLEERRRLRDLERRAPTAAREVWI